MPPRSAARGEAGGRERASSATPMTAPRTGSARARLRHHAACADRLCRIDRARRRDVPRDLPRRADDRAGRLFRPRDHRRAGGLRERFPSSPPRAAVVPARHPWRPLPGGAGPAESYAVLERTRPARSGATAATPELRYLVGTGVSAAAIWRMREALDEAGFQGADRRLLRLRPDKCRVMADAKAPIDVVGTGSFIPDSWQRDLRHRRHRRI
jgi:hypothetical protein